MASGLPVLQTQHHEQQQIYLEVHVVSSPAVSTQCPQKLSEVLYKQHQTGITFTFYYISICTFILPDFRFM